METEEDRRSKLENDAPTKQLRLAMETEEGKKARLEKMVATKQIRLRLALETEEERRAKKRNGFDFKNIYFSRNEFTRPVVGTIFLVSTKQLKPTVK